jgi:hypothetical protein
MSLLLNHLASCAARDAALSAWNRSALLWSARYSDSRCRNASSSRRGLCPSDLVRKSPSVILSFQNARKKGGTRFRRPLVWWTDTCRTTDKGVHVPNVRDAYGLRHVRRPI